MRGDFTNKKIVQRSKTPAQFFHTRLAARLAGVGARHPLCRCDRVRAPAALTRRSCALGAHTGAQSGLVSPQAPPCGPELLGRPVVGLEALCSSVCMAAAASASTGTSSGEGTADGRLLGYAVRCCRLHSAIGCCGVNFCARLLQFVLHLPLLAQFTAVRSCLQSALLSSGLPSSDCPRGPHQRSQRRTALHPCCGYVPCCVNLPYCRANVPCRCANVPCCGAISPCCCPNAPCCCPNAPCCAKVPCARGARFA